MAIGISFTNVQAASIKRMNGSNRIDTANKTAKEIFQKSEAVILVNGTGYADAVSSAPLSKLLNAPILLTENKGALESDVLKTINDLQNVKKNIYSWGYWSCIYNYGKFIKEQGIPSYTLRWTEIWGQNKIWN